MNETQLLAVLHWVLADLPRKRFRWAEPISGARDTYELAAWLDKKVRDQICGFYQS